MEGTIWDFGPDGLQFNQPATVVLRYDDTKVPVGFDETELGVFVVNGVIPYLPAPSVVDPVANTVTATIDHFSYVFLGMREGVTVDLHMDVQPHSLNSDLRVGGVVEYSGLVTNFGPDASNGGTRRLEAFGDVALEAMSSTCTEISDPAPADIAIECPVEPLEVSETSGAGFQIVPQSNGDVVVRGTVSPGAGDTDIDPDNNVDEHSRTFAETHLVDLSPAEPLYPPGAELLELRVGTFHPPSNGGTLIAELQGGDVVLGKVGGSCTQVAEFIVECPFDPFEGFSPTGSGPSSSSRRRRWRLPSPSLTPPTPTT